MRLNLSAVVLAAIVFGGLFFFYRGGGQSSVTATSTAPTQDTTSTATNFDECIAEGNKPLPDAPDKCLTKNGHVFIKGVVE